MLRLLNREWPKFFEALERLKRAQTEGEKVGCQKQVVAGYCADHKVLTDTIPIVEQATAAEFARDDFYIRLMNEAMNAKNGRVPKMDWQLVSGWIEKGYYLMNEKELETAFNRDWNCSPHQKGNTLARRARVNLDLKSGLKRGRKS